MRKILLSTSAMIGLAFAVGTTHSSLAINHQAPNINISGKTNVSMYMFKTYKNINTQEDNKNTKDQKYGLTTRVENSKININAKGSTEAFGGIDYSLLIGLSTDRNQTKTARETTISIENPSYGKISFGNTKGPDSFKKLGASKIMGAMGGFSGNIQEIINVTSGVLWSTGLVGSPGAAVKIVYLSPKIEGFQFALSFTPDTQQHGSGSPQETNINTKTPFDKLNWVGQISYENSFNNGTSIGISLTGVMGNTQDLISKDILFNQVENTASWAIGGQIGYAGWEIAAEYIDNRRSHVNKTHITKGGKAGTAINLGISYSHGPSKVAVGYYHSDKKLGNLTTEGSALDNALTEGLDLGKASADIYSLTYDFKIAPGLTIFAEANYFDMKNQKEENIIRFQNAYNKLNKKASNGNQDKKAHVILVGTKYTF